MPCATSVGVIKISTLVSTAAALPRPRSTVSSVLKPSVVPTLDKMEKELSEGNSVERKGCEID